MKKRAKLTMSSLALTLLCCCACMLAVGNSLPITSKPLDNSPDHLTWDVGIGGKAKKKADRSIFIAPQVAGFNNSLCPPNSKLDYDGKCIQVQSYINPADILVHKLQSILGNGGGTPTTDVDTDYDYYDSSGPYQVNLPLSISFPVDQPGQQLVPEETLYDTTIVDAPTHTKHSSTTEQQSTFPAGTSKQPVDQTPAESHTDISFLAFESLPNGTLSTQLEVDGSNGTVVQNIVLSSTSAAPTTTSVDTDTTPLSSTSTVASSFTDATSTFSSTTVEEFSTTTQSSTTEIASSTEAVVAPSTTEQIQTSESTVPTTTSEQLNETVDDELDDLKSELAEESLMLEASGSTTTELPSTDYSEAEGEFELLSTGSTITTESLTTVDTTTAKIYIHTVPPTPPRRNWPSPKPLQIVTPVRTQWYSPPGATPPPFIVASYTQQDRTTRATPETTTVMQERSTEAPLLVLSDTEDDIKNRDTIHRQEVKDKLSESMDANNRFVYHHLPASSAPVTTLPATTTHNHNYVDQLKIINDIVAENKKRHQQAASGGGGSRIRFPTHEEDHIAAATTGSVVRFPGSVANRGSSTQSANRIPDIFPKKTPDSTTQRPPFWWLPSGWEVDQTGQKPMLLRFWSRMPLVRDQSLTTTSTSGSNSNSNSNSNRWRPSSAGSGSTSPSSVVVPRGNSKSPSENFYKEVSSQDVYKVLNARQLKHKR